MTAISIIICTRNRAEHLQPTLESLAKSDIPEGSSVEVLVVDNGSVDGTAQVFQSADMGYMAKRYIREERGGLSIARNTAIKSVTGDILVFTDDDLRFDEHWLQEICRPIIVGLADATTGTIVVADHLRVLWLLKFFPSLIACRENLEEGVPDSLVGASLAVRRACFDRVPRFDEELGAGALGFGEDWLFSLQLAQAGFRLAKAPRSVIYHHFDVRRTEFRDVLRTCRKRALSDAYMYHHWLHQAFWSKPIWPCLRYSFVLGCKWIFGQRELSVWNAPAYWIIPMYLHLWFFLFGYKIMKEERKYRVRALQKCTL